MGSERCSVTSSNSSSSSSSPPSSSSSGSFSSEADRMVRIELEAAEALADLAHLAMREGGRSDSGGKWGSKGKRGKKRVKSESPPADWFSNPVVDSVRSCPDLAPDGAGVDKQDGESMCRNVVLNSTKAELDEDVPKPSANCVKSHPSYGGSRSRYNLTEAEKEARRLRRILANRESARQTIRRRQALCEELTKKAADLSWENENLKKEKELALKEYESLESRNKNLKAQMAKIIKTEVKESTADPKSAHVEEPTTTATNCSLLLYNQHPFPSLCWPSIVQSGNSAHAHHGPQNAIIIQSSNPIHPHHGPQSNIVVPSLSMPHDGDLDSSHQQQENPMIVNGSRTPLYIVSCPWFFSVLDHRNRIHPQSSGLQCIKDGNSLDNQCSSSSSSKAAALMENQLFSLPKKVKSEVAGSTEVRVINDLNETPVGFPPDGGGQCGGPHLDETALTPLLFSTVIPAVAGKNENGSQLELVSHTNGICTKPSQLLSALPENNQDLLKFPSKKLVDVAAAAEARRRRKELTKLKNLHTRQCRMNC
ncbi:hypothetical protein JCGZ_23658 [Jatropha curcas]|uniref:BZIP domain-containing protein n=1 Tax=Jatropha curcas TaxID=180498 RepID=A0A067L6B0_JATCU|nr:hypothetical protein JCGZ_23658 [Jatropha curcas]